VPCFVDANQLLYDLQELLLAEEKAANQLELEREKDSVARLSQARADIEEQRRILAMLD